MVPHPTTWQNARERERQDLLAAADRMGWATRSQAGKATRTPGGHPRLAMMLSAPLLALRRALPPRPRTLFGRPATVLREIRFRSPRLLSR